MSIWNIEYIARSIRHVLTIKPNINSSFYSKENYVINPKESHVFWTDVKAQMYFDNVLNIYARSGLGCKYGVVPKNCVGIIDASYYGNEKNDGGIGICLENKGDEPYSVKVGDRIAQGVFTKYYITDDDKEYAVQEGGNSKQIYTKPSCITLLFKCSKFKQRYKQSSDTPSYSAGKRSFNTPPTC